MEGTQTRGVKNRSARVIAVAGKTTSKDGRKLHSGRHSLFSLLSIIEETVQDKARSSIQTSASPSLTEA
jgi:hypothetical protein